MRYVLWLLLLFVPSSLASQSAAVSVTPSPHAINIPKWFSLSFLDFQEDVAEAAREGRRLMVYVGQDGCPYCTALMKVNFGDAAITAYTRRHFVAVALNLWGDREVKWIDGSIMSEKALAAKLRVQYTPTLLFFDESARVVLRLNGYTPPDKFRQALDFVVGRHEAKQSFADYVAGKAPPAARTSLGAQPFFTRGETHLARLVTDASKPLVLVFEQRACRECDEIHRDAFSLPKVRAQMARFHAVQLDARGARAVVGLNGARTTEARLAHELQVVYTPSLIFFDSGGREVFRAEGYMRPFHVESVLDYVASGAYRREPSFQRFIKQRADEAHAAGRQVVLW